MKRLLLSAVGAVALAAASQAQAADLTIWGLQAFNPDADRFIGETAKAYGEEIGLDVEYVVVPANVINERLAAAYAGGNPPDVVMNSDTYVQRFMAQGLTVPLDDLLEELRAQPGGIFENTLGAGLYEGQQHALPVEMDVNPMFVRTDLLAEVGHDVPETWEELRAAAQAIHEAYPMLQPFGMPLSGAFDGEVMIRMVIWSFGGALFDEEGNIIFDSPETRAAYAFLAGMVEEGTIPHAALTWDDAGNNTAYQSGRAAFIINPPSVYSWLQENDPEMLANTALINIPTGPGPEGRNGSMVSSWMWFISAASDQIDAAKGWLRYFYEPETYAELITTVGGRWVPIYPSMIDELPMYTENPHFAAFRSMAETGIVMGYRGVPTVLASEIVHAKIVSNVVQRIVVEGQSVEEAVAWGQAEMERLAAQH